MRFWNFACLYCDAPLDIIRNVISYEKAFFISTQLRLKPLRCDMCVVTF